MTIQNPVKLYYSKLVTQTTARTIRIIVYPAAFHNIFYKFRIQYLVFVLYVKKILPVTFCLSYKNMAKKILFL
jgi:hypothetical protein